MNLFFLLSLLIASFLGNVDNDELIEDKAMAHYLTAPDRAIEILDSAVAANGFSPQRADYLKTIIAYSRPEGITESYDMCRKLIDEKVWESVSDDSESLSLQVDIYRLMATISTTTGNNLSVIRYSREGAEIAHGIEMFRGDEADFLSRMGYVMCGFGEISEGLEMMYRAEHLSLSDKTWSSFLSYLNNSKKIISVYEYQGRYDEARQKVMKTLEILERLRLDIKNLKYVPSGFLEDPLSLEEFIQYNKVTLYSFLSSAYADTNQLDSAAFYIRKVKEIPQSDNPLITKSLIHPLVLLGRFDEAEALISAVRQTAEGVDINEETISLLKEELHIATMKGQKEKALSISRDIISKSDSLNTNNYKVLLADAATQFRLQDENQRRIDAEKRALVSLIIIILLVVVAGSCASAFFVNRIIKRNKALKIKYEETKEELAELEEKTKESLDSITTSEEIYSRAVELVSGQMLFKDSELDSSSLAKLIPTNRTYLSTAINTVSGMNFRTWLAKYRVEYAKQVLLEKPDISNDRLADECGFDNRTSLYRQFKNFEGLTPNEWIKQK